MNCDKFLELKKLSIENLTTPYCGGKIIYNPINYLFYVDINGNLLSNHRFQNYAF